MLAGLSGMERENFILKAIFRPLSRIAKGFNVEFGFIAKA
jgi:hypothetical protein